MKKAIIIISVSVALLLAAGALLLLRGEEDKWICQKGKWIKHGNPYAPMPKETCDKSSSEIYRELETAPSENTEPELIGGQKDEHGCLIGAGYSWCEEKEKCLRTWEESCP